MVKIPISTSGLERCRTGNLHYRCTAWTAFDRHGDPSSKSKNLLYQILDDLVLHMFGKWLLTFTHSHTLYSARSWWNKSIQSDRVIKGNRKYDLIAIMSEPRRFLDRQWVEQKDDALTAAQRNEEGLCFFTSPNIFSECIKQQVFPCLSASLPIPFSILSVWTIPVLCCLLAATSAQRHVMAGPSTPRRVARHRLSDCHWEQYTQPGIHCTQTQKHNLLSTKTLISYNTWCHTRLFFWFSSKKAEMLSVFNLRVYSCVHVQPCLDNCTILN